MCINGSLKHQVSSLQDLPTEISLLVLSLLNLGSACGNLGLLASVRHLYGWQLGITVGQLIGYKKGASPIRYDAPYVINPMRQFSISSLRAYLQDSFGFLSYSH